MTGTTEMADQWEGARAPKIKPTPIDKTWRNDQDPTRRRATFRVPYPLLEICIEKSDDLHTKLPARFERTKRRLIPGVRVYLLIPNVVFSDTDFRECSFHRRDAEGESKVSASTFKNCNLQRCMLGGTLFHQLTFEGCTFERCDFEGSKFVECQFINCKFTECTAVNTTFVATELDPTTLRGMRRRRPPDFCATLKRLAFSVVQRRKVPPSSKVSKQWPRS
jgi:hypothetical protein